MRDFKSNSTQCSLVDIAPTISELLEIPMVPPDGKVIQDVIEYANICGCQKVVLIIVDSLGYSLYRYFSESGSIFNNIRQLAGSGMVLRCQSTADHTTPAIASIFTGYYPTKHHIYATDDIYRERAKDPANPKIQTILEWAYDAGCRSAVVIESLGADTFLDRVGEVFGVPDSKDIIEYDSKITDAAVQALESKPDILAVHLRAIDRYAHRAHTWDELKYAAGTVDENIGRIVMAAEKGTLFMICGDHPIHASAKWMKSASKTWVGECQGQLVALIISMPQNKCSKF
ncbi:MAG: sulfatase-like hydrolase/transferase [Methanosarcinaceae archaeon]|nr:sulfatase-like hydrolase/transferase [Methanosarcinaceae archaeon]